MFKFIKNYFNYNTKSEEQIEENTEDGKPLININFLLTTQGTLFIDLENSNRPFEAVELATLINYVSSFRGQMDTLELIQSNLLDQDLKQLHDDFIQLYIDLKTNEAQELTDRKEADSTPYINPSEMLP
tara:strand:- start:969 stop:1355 length:387 start_codon:yes stop_codon:yes gene_type:complete